ncbi:Boi1p [Sugiyamaella lignohabitans]|uniref:Boi1p n=1 Tax=Sugiyamaella lignohabitans TaxID=796027 RepID=A0A167CKA8_9ASCO|nr:Boi1p [Sugiyamaella lignohabitans]ANB11806.1 Boi1p [Sugiyamaella lignohabitans]
MTGLFPKVFTTELIVTNEPSGGNRTSEIRHKVLSGSSVSGGSSGVGSTAGPSVHDTISDIDEAISEFQNRGIGGVTAGISPAMSSPGQGSGPRSPLVHNSHANGEFNGNGSNSHMSNGGPNHQQYADNNAIGSNDGGLPSLNDIPNWTSYDISQYFAYRGYEPDVCEQFIRHKITGSILLELDLAYLKEIDIASFGTRFEISKDIKHLNSLVSAQMTGEGASIAAATAAIKRKSKAKSTHSRDRTASSSKGLMLPPQTSPKKNPINDRTSPPVNPRTSSLRSSISTTNETTFSAIGSPYHAKNRSNDSDVVRHPSFNPNWTHPIKTSADLDSPQTPEIVNDNSAHFTSNIGLLSPNSLNEYNETVPVPRSPQSQVPAGRRRSYTIDALTSRFDSSPLQPATAPTNTQQHIRNPSGDTLRDKAKENFYQRGHARSTSSLGLQARNDDITKSANEARKSHRRHSSIMSFMTTTQNLASTLTSPTESQVEQSNDLNAYSSSSREDIGMESESGASSVGISSSASGNNSTSSTAKKYLDLLPGRGNNNNNNSSANNNSATKRIGTDPIQSVTEAPPPSPKRSATFTKPKLRSTPSQPNLKKISKQQTSAFMEGIRQITADEAAKTASVSGWLHKRGGVGVGTWKSRYFTLHGTRLSYFTSQKDTKERGLIDITAHRVLPARESEDKLISIYAASVGAGRHCFKLVPPAPGFKKGVTFTAPKVHYFAVDTKEEMRMWMASLMKATIDRDDSVPVISSCATPTVPLPRAQELFAEARARDEDLRARMIAGGLASNPSSNAISNKARANNSSSTNETYPTTPDSPTGSSLQSSRTVSSTNSSSLKVSSPSSFSPVAAFGEYQPSDIRHLTTKTAGLQIVTNLEDS